MVGTTPVAPKEDYGHREQQLAVKIMTPYQFIARTNGMMHYSNPVNYVSSRVGRCYWSFYVLSVTVRYGDINVGLKHKPTPTDELRALKTYET